MKIVKYILSRVSEPSSFAAIGVAAIGVGILTGFEWLAVIGVVGGILGVVVAEKNQN
jgi:type IV secretory pathway VirB2 component (pilin)|tara:strand:+ start:791 stop:961 length:171 start_codon:yes stop_codon:yes gene_type:complete